MPVTMFDQFKSILKQLIDDVDIIRKNSLFSDEVYRDNLKDRVDALTSDISIRQDYASALDPSLGMLVKNTSERKIQFIPKGFETYLSAFREGVLDTPKHIFKLDGLGNDPRYVISDSVKGVVIANSELNSLFRFPHFGPITATEYNDPAAAVVWEQTSIKYIAIASYSHHLVQIYLWEDPYTHIATIGTLDTPGSAADLCNFPRGLAVDVTNELLYICNEEGTPAGATADKGFIAIYDISTIATPVQTSIPWFYLSTGSLLDGEVDGPADIAFDATAEVLWVVNGPLLNEVGGFNASATDPTNLVRYIDPAGSGYTLRTPGQVCIHSLIGGYKRIYVSNSNTGVVEEFDYLNLKHLNSFGYRASEDDLNTYSRLSTDVYGALGTPTAVVADQVSIDGEDVDTLVVGDILNKRIHRFNLNAYTQDNFINFEMIELDVPVTIYGWAISGDIPLDMLSVFYRNSETEEFRELPRETNTPPSSTYQFRVAATLKPNQFIRTWDIKHLRINAEQV